MKKSTKKKTVDIFICEICKKEYEKEHQAWSCEYSCEQRICKHPEFKYDLKIVYGDGCMFVNINRIQKICGVCDKVIVEHTFFDTESSLKKVFDMFDKYWVNEELK